MQSQNLIGVILILLFNLVYSDNRGITVLSCQSDDGLCNDSTCGFSGTVADNWIVQGNGCVIADCSKLTETNANISINACSSCYNSGKTKLQPSPKICVPTNTISNSSIINYSLLLLIILTI
ncbi:cell surface immobilization antigen SerH6, putative (macronuclear) [Tetrahymena thermophila SB210]|uniref:Cell surface immobilization antigen SerH6, putative n=1 Tax=Tetrahymena thermophila (strain SB210) TaxID=312017 RepID=Q237R5_TETTS|nr:cell surface immobilization antigen SerH6, putative [Tetrahymena thermophila SB210]EAR92676.1 cell surface immobilization antigen SerH6, putative [Tetrahymena thermophila SB210]|eukprot:XP_001012921.1 cell surface immobilization antigen SerH6, putative [Tetrahymena thermophila SB210]